MKALSTIGLLFVAAFIATFPVSPQVTPRGIELTVDQAQAQVTYGRAPGRVSTAGKPLCTPRRQAVLPLWTPGRLRLRLSSRSGGSWKVVHDQSKWFPLVLDIFLTRHVVVQAPLAEGASEYVVSA